MWDFLVGKNMLYLIMRLDLEQKKSLSNYSGNLSIAWFGAGIIGPIVTKQNLNESKDVMIPSILLSIVFLLVMLILIKERKKRK